MQQSQNEPGYAALRFSSRSGSPDRHGGLDMRLRPPVFDRQMLVGAERGDTIAQGHGMRLPVATPKGVRAIKGKLRHY
jgi:hypothetical protein